MVSDLVSALWYGLVMAIYYVVVVFCFGFLIYGVLKLIDRFTGRSIANTYKAWIQSLEADLRRRGEASSDDSPPREA